MKLIKRAYKIYYSNEGHREGCANRGTRPFRSGFLSRSRNRRGLSLPEAMVSLSIMSMFMTMCCGSMVQYQNVFGRVERSMTYTQQLQVGLDVIMRDIAESNLSTFTNGENVPLTFTSPVDLSQTPVILKVAAGTNGHGDNFYSTFRIRLSVNDNNELVREFLVPGQRPLPKTLATHVDNVILSRVCGLPRVCTNDDEYLDNALSVSVTSTTLISDRDQAAREQAAENPENTSTYTSIADPYAHEKKSVSIDRIVRLNN